MPKKRKTHLSRQTPAAMQQKRKRQHERLEKLHHDAAGARDAENLEESSVILEQAHHQNQTELLRVRDCPACTHHAVNEQCTQSISQQFLEQRPAWPVELKPLKTTRILAEVDDDACGTESFDANDAATSGLEERDMLLSQYETRDDDDCPLLTECDDEEFEDTQRVSCDSPVVTVISSSSSENVAITTSRRGRPVKQVQLNVQGDSDLLPIDEDSVGPVLEKLLAMMQSMSMLLSALKTDLRHNAVPDVQIKKRDAAITQLWRALVAYQKSFSEIEQFAHSSKSEQFACSSGAGGQTTTMSSGVPSQSHVNTVKNVAGGPPLSRQRSETHEVIELSGSDTESDEEDPECKRPRYETVELSTSTPVSSSAEEVTDPAVENDSSYAPSASTSNVSCDDVTISSDEVWGMQSEGEPIVEFQAA